MDIKFQLKDFVTEFCEDINNGFSENTINKIVDYLINEYGLDKMDENEIKEFLETGEVERLITMF